ncbi:MAG: DR2241 family protein [Verrucomicrobiota bacterium]
MKPTEFLKQWISQTPPPWRIGEVEIDSLFTICHQADVTCKPTLRPLSLETLTEFVKKTSSGNFRSLHAAPTLSRGWKVSPSCFEELVEALRIIYPGAIAHWSDWSQKNIRVTPFLETAERQTGMYHCTRLLNQEQLLSLTQTVCAPGCLKQRLWKPADQIPTSPREIPLLCPEACNFLIAKAREVVKSMTPKN